MSETPSPETILQNLVHADLSLRRRGFNQVKIHWDLPFREYVYTAIENEKNRLFQSEMVQFILLTLKDSSLRKMIRFEEKGKLFPKSRQLLIQYYLEYETTLVREALIKSLKRTGSQTCTLVTSVLGSPEIITIWGDQPSRINQFLEDCLEPAIPDIHRFDIVSVFMTRYIQQSSFRRVTGTNIWLILSESPLLHTFVLNKFFKTSSPKTTVNVKLIWQNWNWSVSGSSIAHREFSSSITEYDEFIITSARSSSTQVLEAVIPVLGNLRVLPPPFQNQGYEDLLTQIWSDLIEGDHIHWLVDYLDEVSVDTLELLDDRTKISFSQLDNEVNLHDLFLRITGYYPRHLLLDLLSNENSSIRALVLHYLRDIDLFLVENVTITPLPSWIMLFSIILDNKERDQVEIDNITSFLFLIIPQLVKITSNDRKPIIDYVISQSSSISTNPKLWPIAFMQYYLFDLPLPDLPKKGILSQNQLQNVLSYFFDIECPSTLLPSIKHLIGHLSYQLIIELLERIQTSLQVDNSEVLLDLLNSLAKHQDVRVRTRAKLVAQNLN